MITKKGADNTEHKNNALAITNRRKLRSVLRRLIFLIATLNPFPPPSVSPENSFIRE